MIAAADLELNGQLRIELRHRLGGGRLEQLELQTAPQPSLVDIGQQRVHLGLARQLLEERAERFLDVFELLAVGIQIDRLALLLEERLAQLSLLAAMSVELLHLVLPIEPVAHE